MPLPSSNNVPALSTRPLGRRVAWAYGLVVLLGLGLYLSASATNHATPSFSKALRLVAPTCASGASGELPLLSLGVRVSPSSWNRHRQRHPLFLIDGSRQRRLTWSPAPRDLAPAFTLHLPEPARLDSLDLHLSRSLRRTTFSAQCLDADGLPIAPAADLPRQSGLLRTAALHCPRARALRITLDLDPDSPSPELTEVTLRGCLHAPD